MLQKLKITTYVFILCIFGLTLITVSPIYAEDSAAINNCEKMSKHRRGKRFVRSTDQINCYKSLVRELTARVNKLESGEGPVDSRVLYRLKVSFVDQDECVDSHRDEYLLNYGR